MTEVPPFLHKYVIGERLDVLQDQRIRFTQPAALNDPFEFKAYFEKAVDTEDLSELIAANPEAKALWPRLNPKMRGVLEKNLIQSINAAVPELFDDLMSKVGEQLGILSLSEAATSEPMWAHYADDHRGFLIEFESSAPFFNRRRSAKDESYWLRQVQYREARSVEKLFGATGDDFFLVKGSEWVYEREWRMLAPVKDADHVRELGGDTIHLFDFPPSCVSGLVLGNRSPPSLRGQVRQLLASRDYSHVRLGEIRLRTRDSGLEVSWGGE